MKMATDKKGITVKVDADLHAEIREYLDAHQMTMAEFISLAVEDELHPKYQEKEENTMEKMRTLAFQVPEDLFQRIKDYLHRNNMTQKEFVIGLIESEIDRDLTERETQDNTEEEAVEDEVYDGEELEDGYDEDELDEEDLDENEDDEILDTDEDLAEDEDVEETDDTELVDDEVEEDESELTEDDFDEEETDDPDEDFEDEESEDLEEDDEYTEDEEESSGMGMEMSM
jgi:hypothetical protein